MLRCLSFGEATRLKSSIEYEGLGSVSSEEEREFKLLCFLFGGRVNA